uniref:Ataxin-2-like protein-like isoform X2 n=1 Tax=Saccoglossus kowalevskii TaxID=10224 RepID=A0ABM0N036_SACKO|nr:PREDICTED: ataxin-2-like protein-like isoform X2 [Saccoglossus kowalevskii]
MNHRQPRKSRANTGRSGRGGMTKGPGPQAVVSNFDGIYSSPRFTYVLAAITGCVVQVQVKNGGTYEGIFRTASPKADFVLEMAHKLEETAHRDQSPAVPSRDRVIDKLILKSQDIVSLNTFDVDLDYAAKEGTFATDSMISSKVNGQVTERDLTPWVGEVQSEEGSLENEASNGWDVNDMLRTNAEKFNVTSTFDEDMGQYTTRLEKKDTKEYKDREESAQKLANEIESSPSYKQRLQKEVEDGTEEDKYSAVQRPGFDSMNNRSNTPPMHGGGGGPGGQRYVPPQMRNRDMAHSPRVSTSPQDVRVAGYGSSHGPPRGGSHGSPHDPRSSYTPRRPMQPGVRQPSAPRESHSVKENVHTNLNGGVERGDRKPPEVGAPAPPSAYQDRRKLSDVVRGAPPDPKPPSQPAQNVANNSSSISNSPTVAASTPNPDQPQQLPLTSPPQQDSNSSVVSPVEKKPTAHARNGLEDLKKFSSQFILQGEKGREVEKDAAKDNPECKPTPDTSSPTTVATETTATTTKETCTSTTPTPTSNPDENQKPDDPPKKSTLNPNAKEFKFNPQAKPFAPKASVPKTPTPPRQQQPSPVIMPPQAVMQVPHSMSYTGQPVISNIQGSYVVASPHTQMQHMIGSGGVPQVPQKAAYPQKRAPMMPQQRPQPPHVDISQSGHIMPASAAAGQPIMAPMHYSQAQFVHYPTQHTQAMMGQHVMQQPVHYQHMTQYPQKPMYRIQGALQSSPHPQAQHTYQMSPQDVQASATHVLMSPQGPTIPQPMPHPQAQHQHQAHQQQHPQPQPHMHHGHVQQPHTPPLQGQQQGQTQQQTQMAGQQQLQQQQHVHQAPSPVHQVPHSGQPPTQNTHIPQQPSHQIIYQNPHQMPPQPLAQSPQGMHAQPQPTLSQAQAQPHQMQQVPVVSHPPNPHITTVTPVHPHPYPHTHQQPPPMQQQQPVMVIPQAPHPHGSQAAATAAAHAGGTAGVVVSNAPAAMSAPYLQVDGKVMVLTESNAYYSAAPQRMNSPGPPTHQQQVHPTYQQGN